jgi:hypothetical protein
MHLSLVFDPPPQPADIPALRDSPVCRTAEVAPAQHIHSPAVETHCRDRYKQYQFSTDDDEKLVQHVFIYILSDSYWQCGPARRFWHFWVIRRKNNIFGYLNLKP